MTEPAHERVCRFHRRGEAGQAQIGDRVTITIDGIGTLDNTVVAV